MTGMNLSRAAIAAATGALLLVQAGPAAAQRVAVTDPAGDGLQPGLDIVRAAVANRDYRIVARVQFAEEVRGDVIVSIDRRAGRGLRLVNEHRPAGTDRSYVLDGAFTDSKPGSRTKCRALRVRWEQEEPVVVMTLPSRCLNGGSYGAIRFAVLTERGGDTDYAPETDGGSSAWIPRG
jgi:hypothetical protein